MNNQIRTVLRKRYEAEIADAKYKIKCYSEHELVIPEHPDITAEIDKLLQKIAEAEDKVAVMRKYYGKNKADKQVLQGSQIDSRVRDCPFTLRSARGKFYKKGYNLEPF